MNSTLRRYKPLRSRPEGRSKLAALDPGTPRCQRCPRAATVLAMWCDSCAETVANERVGNFVKARDKVCVACGKKGPLEWAHILRRSYKRIQWEPRNAVALCSSDHRLIDSSKEAHRAFFNKRYPGRIEELQRLARTAPRPDLAAIITTYRGRAA